MLNVANALASKLATCSGHTNKKNAMDLNLAALARLRSIAFFLITGEQTQFDILSSTLLLLLCAKQEVYRRHF